MGIRLLRSGLHASRRVFHIHVRQLGQLEDGFEALFDAHVAIVDDRLQLVDAVVDPLALSMPSHVPFHAAKGFTLSLAKQVLNGKMDSVIKTIERNTGLV